MKTGADSPLIWEETRGRFTSHLETQAERHPALQPFVDEMSKEYFTDKSYASWLKQFKVFEDGKAFRNALEAVTSGRKPTDRNVRSSDCTRVTQRVV